MSQSVTHGDVKLFQTAPNWADIALSAENTSELILDDGLENYVLISLSTNQRALNTDTLPADSNDKQGWWGDIFEPSYKIGSRLWLRQRYKIGNALLTDVKQDVQDALQWMIDDLIFDSIEVTVARNPQRSDEILISIQGFKQDLGQIGFAYFFNWSNQVFRKGVVNAA